MNELYKVIEISWNSNSLDFVFVIVLNGLISKFSTGISQYASKDWNLESWLIDLSTNLKVTSYFVWMYALRF